jgi:hypothetical protein
MLDFVDDSVLYQCEQLASAARPLAVKVMYSRRSAPVDEQTRFIVLQAQGMLHSLFFSEQMRRGLQQMLQLVDREKCTLDVEHLITPLYHFTQLPEPPQQGLRICAIFDQLVYFTQARNMMLLDSFMNKHF